MEVYFLRINMSTIDCFLVAPRLGWLEHLRIATAHDFEVLDRNHTLYVPEKFILGYFKERKLKEGKSTYTLGTGGVYFREEPSRLQEYEKLLQERKLEIVQDVVIPEVDLAFLIEQGRLLNSAKENIRGKFLSVDKYIK